VVVGRTAVVWLVATTCHFEPEPKFLNLSERIAACARDDPLLHVESVAAMLMLMPYAMPHTQWSKSSHHRASDSQSHGHICFFGPVPEPLAVSSLFYIYFRFF